jgi:hypothetical protein
MQQFIRTIIRRSLHQQVLLRILLIAGLLVSMMVMRPEAARATGFGTVVGWGLNNIGQTTIPADLTGVTAIAAGYFHSLALKSDGTVAGWGGNSNGELAIPTDLTGVTAISAFYLHSLALKSDGMVVGWGQNSDGQGTIPADLTDVTAIAAGGFHSLALKSNGTVVGWGQNHDGQRTIPVDLTGVTAIAAGSYHSLAIVQAAPEPCPAGQYNNGSGCVNAEPGYYVAATGATEQTPCALGTFQPHSGAVSCNLAPAGYYVDVEAALAAIACSAGSYQPNSGASSCMLASAGYYVPASGSIAQILCPEGTTSTMGAAACTLAGFHFTGFLQPVDNMPVINTAKGGQGIPVKFGLGGNQGMNIFADGYPTSSQITCSNTATDAIEVTVTAGTSSLAYDAVSDQYTYVWKTDKAWANTCRILTVKFTDGTIHQANFKFTK